ncbi:hypothetical protein CA234_03130 [Sphingomonas sp. ABOLE]|uniref:hypothetical protein n=1 Tax=Sphingomonas sp. ABOLE TaxID=1985878 RepID=UPI000F7E2F56|nr:hypothetical protein [Sphingomonas sp. ABOLE]RSV44422.1 hypothetical protein CA234_03130 [Sphingomonas sp. ABOLE]
MEGLELWDENGNSIASIYTATVSQLGTEVGRTSAFTITDDRFLKGIPWAFYIPAGVYNVENPPFGEPVMTLSGNQLIVNGSNFNGTFLYGIR